MKNLLLAGLAMIALSVPAYGADYDAVKNYPMNGKRIIYQQAPRQQQMRFELYDKRPILVHIGVVDKIVSELPFLHRYVERVPIERPWPWQERADQRANAVAISIPTANIPMPNMIRRRSTELSSAVINKGIDHLLREEFHIERSNFDINTRPTRGGAAVYFKFSFK